MNNRILNRFAFSLLLVALITFQCFSSHSLADRPIRLIVDGKDITSLTSPIIENGRTLVPIRFVAEELGATVDWSQNERRVNIVKEDRLISMKIDSRLVLLKQEKKAFSLIDVAPKIIDGRTFVPLRLVSNAFGIGIEWDDSNRMIYIDSNKQSNIEPFFDIRISGLANGQTITGKTELQIELPNNYQSNVKEIKYLLLDPNTSEGFIIARGNDLNDKYIWLPQLEDQGEKALVAALYDEKGQFLAGDAILVNLNILPSVSITGITAGQVFDTTIFLGADINFIASYIKYNIINLDTGETKVIGGDVPLDPYGQYKWDPQLKENGNYSIKAVAYDSNNTAYESASIPITVRVGAKLGLSGITNGQTIDRPVNLLANRNFDVKSTEYILRDPQSRKEQTIAKIPYGSYNWFPEPGVTGNKEVFVRVEDSRGTYHESMPINVVLTGKPILMLEGVGPKQVLKDTTKLKVNSNVKLDSVDYLLINQVTGEKKYIAKDQSPSEEQSYTPSTQDIGYWNIKAVGKYNGNTISSDGIPMRIYLGSLYKSSPIVEKDKFLDLASNLAIESWHKTGMSAALQTAQSILETGWGQSLPVDKYSGQQSYNLFGIKGKGPAGTVTYNTWEVYNGKTYYVDAEFRAYNNVKESWNDHKNFLLSSSRYVPFKEVMHSSVQGAWALRRTGYATDPEYALKLMKIIKQYNLDKLDKIGI